MKEVTPYLSIGGAAQAMEFYNGVRRQGADAHEYPPMDFLGPQSRGGTAVHLHVAEMAAKG